WPAGFGRVTTRTPLVVYIQDRHGGCELGRRPHIVRVVAQAALKAVIRLRDMKTHAVGSIHILVEFVFCLGKMNRVLELPVYSCKVVGRVRLRAGWIAARMTIHAAF